uniref:Uncharacterized protein n=1 Tax=Magallana gigas TaxID=29159 RepID=A0A8W8MFL6_MAGGI
MAAPSITKLQEIFEVKKLSAEQEKATDSLLAKKDVFLSLLGQVVGNLCYMALPIFYEHSNSLDVQVMMPQVLILSPLLTIMKEQTDLLVLKGFTATFIGKDKSEDASILDGADRESGVPNTTGYCSEGTKESMRQ